MQASTQVARKVGSRQTGRLPGWQVHRQTMAECLNGVITFVLMTFARMALLQARYKNCKIWQSLAKTELYSMLSKLQLV
jgi:hypothetical protein